MSPSTRKSKQPSTSRTRQFTPGPVGPDVDLDAEEVYLADGSRLTEARAQEIAEEVMERVHARRGGRPSITGAPEKTPGLNIRVPKSTREALEAIAVREGRRLAEVGREALDEYVARHREAS